MHLLCCALSCLQWVGIALPIAMVMGKDPCQSEGGACRARIARDPGPDLCTVCLAAALRSSATARRWSSAAAAPQSCARPPAARPASQRVSPLECARIVVLANLTLLVHTKLLDRNWGRGVFSFLRRNPMKASNLVYLYVVSIIPDFRSPL